MSGAEIHGRDKLSAFDEVNMKPAAEIDLSGSFETPMAETKSFLESESDTSGGLGSWLPKLFPAKSSTTGVATEWISRRRQGLRPWREFFKTDKFKMPTGPTVIGRRLMTNVEQFQSNYFCVFIVLFVYCILTSPMLLIGLGVMFGASLYVRSKSGQQPMKFGTFELTPPYQYAIVALLSFPLFYIAGAGATIFWVIGASIFIVVLHALMYASEPIPGAEFQMENV